MTAKHKTASAYELSTLILVDHGYKLTDCYRERVTKWIGPENSTLIIEVDNESGFVSVYPMIQSCQTSNLTVLLLEVNSISKF